MSTFDYTAAAELFAAKGRIGLRYLRFARATEAVRCAIKKLPPKVLPGTSSKSTISFPMLGKFVPFMRASAILLPATTAHDEVAPDMRIYGTDPPGHPRGQCRHDSAHRADALHTESIRSCL